MTLQSYVTYGYPRMVYQRLETLTQLLGIKVLELRAFGPTPGEKGLWSWHDLRRAKALPRQPPALQSVYSFLHPIFLGAQYARSTHDGYEPEAQEVPVDLQIEMEKFGQAAAKKKKLRAGGGAPPLALLRWRRKGT